MLIRMMMITRNVLEVTVGGSDSMGPMKHQSDTLGPDGTMTTWLCIPDNVYVSVSIANVHVNIVNVNVSSVDSIIVNAKVMMRLLLTLLW